ncbi:hypothetical protein BP6252_07958 [Coleophoma cylindrospora]|uniref:SWIM-type domain-containing protein n=1 Tax=Coleophoma cylindrospora TaxID=1849047 RepID=A0A3D8RBJ9_9HELO|nr:hypothetical protein BP6252_07958 [Coleophoma cylindrospora]
MSKLPTPRVFLTALINDISAIPAPITSTTTTTTDSGPNHPLRSLAPAHRALLSTLHVVFPNNIFLPALDLLDRGLVTRLVQVEASVPPPEVLQDATTAGAAPSLEGGPRNAVYQVRSAQQPRSRFHQTAATTSTPVYTVRLEAWSCSCAAFTFSAFPATAGLFQPRVLGEDEDEDGERVGEEDWRFGGLSLGTGGEEMPCCKHLLACLLGEKWNAVLGSYVTVREVSREEMAGVGADA